MTYLVTGGAGFIGSNFLDYVTTKYRNDMFICLDSLTYAGSMENLSDVEGRKNFKFVKGNIIDKVFINRLLNKEKIDQIVNFAAETHVDNSIENPSVFMKSNIYGVSVLLDACLKHPGIKFHQVSTDEVYGDLPLDESKGFDEDARIRPSSPYASSKASADIIALSYYRTYNLPVTISRSSNNYGPRQNFEKFIPLVIKKALANEKIPVYGTGLNVRDWIYVEDHCKALDLILNKGKPGQIYNISSHNEIGNLQLANTILNLLGKSDNLINLVEDRPGHDLRYSTLTEKIEKELGWNPEYGLEDGLPKTIEWYIRKIG